GRGLHGGGVSQDLRARGGEGDAVGLALEQLGAEAVFETVDPPAQGRLGNAEPGRRLIEATGVGCHYEIPQVVPVDRAPQDQLFDFVFLHNPYTTFAEATPAPLCSCFRHVEFVPAPSYAETPADRQ